jgi:hypothetical protein
MVRSVSGRHLTPVFQVHSDVGTGFFQAHRFIPASIVPPVFRTQNSLPVNFFN